MKTIIANWKSNPNSAKAAVILAKSAEKAAAKYPQAEVVVAPPFLYLNEVKGELRRAKLGAQDSFWNEGGAYTGEVNLAQLKAAGVSHVVVGHSERRRYLNEGDEVINRKVSASLRYGLQVVLCVGNQERSEDPMRVISSQLAQDLKGLAPGDRVENLTVAYEPIWAIGTGEAENSEGAASVAARIKEQLARYWKIESPRVLYGGSVDAKNIAEFLGMEEIDGVLVGGASLKAAEFGKMIKATNSKS
ncbi:MAG: triose-phosphate isomerase [Patescibacteria group bacterium]|nr:triose-phosphate isomerase [Patescibacteria group bacterium]